MNFAPNGHTGHSRLEVVLISFGLVLSLSGCLAPVPQHHNPPAVDHSTDLTSCGELVPTSILESSGMDPMSASDENFGDDPPYSIIPKDQFVQRLGGMACFWSGPEPEYDPDVLMGATQSTLAVEALPGAAAHWLKMREIYGSAADEASCSTRTAGSAICAGTRLVGDLLVSVRFSGFALDASIVEEYEGSALLDAAAAAFAPVRESIEGRVTAATLPPAPEIGTPLAVVNGRDCAALVPHERVAMLADSYTAQSGLMYASSSLSDIGLDIIGSGECYWTPLFTIDREDPDWDFEGSEEYEYEEWGHFTVSWRSHAADDIPRGTPVVIQGLSAKDSAQLRADSVQPIIDIDFEGHWIAVTAENVVDADESRVRFAELVVAALQR